MKNTFLKYVLKCNGLIILNLLIGCNSVSDKTSTSTDHEVASYLFQDTTIKKYLFEGGYEGAILEGYREENKMFPYKTSHTRLKVGLTEDSTFIVSYLFFKSTPATPDTVIYFLRRDHPENSHFLKKEPRQKMKTVETAVNLFYEGMQTILLSEETYEIFKFRSKDSLGTEFHFWLPEIGIIKLESSVYDRSFVLSFAPEDVRTKIIEEILRKTSL